MSNNQEGKKWSCNISFDICIIGGGASGIAAAISAAEINPELNICILEKKDELGKKLLATGNGKCNITNIDCDGFDRVTEFFKRTGIMIKEDGGGRMYPYCEQASAVLDLLKSRVKHLNITVFTDCSVLTVNRSKFRGFDVHIDGAKGKAFIPCSKILIACGGKAGPQFGTTGDGYALAKKFGHAVTRICPILMPLECEGIEKKLKGIRAKGKVCLLKGENIVAEESGEIQFTEEGLSGICIFNLTRYIKLEPTSDFPLSKAFRQYSVVLDFLPHMDKREVMKYLEERQVVMECLPKEDYLISVLNTKLAKGIVHKVLGETTGTVGNIDFEAIKEIAMLLKSSRYVVTGGKGWKEAQCTGGGIPLEEIDPENMESKIEKGIFFAGEILDYDGPCGGFNLNNAWLTGIKAGNGLALSLTTEQVIGE